MSNLKAVKWAMGFVAMAGIALAVTACVPATGGYVGVSDEGVSGYFEPPYAEPGYVGRGYGGPIYEAPPIYLPPTPRVVYGEVPYVVGVDQPVYYVNDYFYTPYRGQWFVTARPGGPWGRIDMRYLPESLRRGAPPTVRAESAGPIRTVTQFREALPTGAELIEMRGAAGTQSQERGAQPSSRGMTREAPIMQTPSSPAERGTLQPDVTAPMAPPAAPEELRTRPRPGRMPGRAG